MCGPQDLQEYLVNEVQEVYRLQGVEINDKHIEVIVRQMLKKVRITDPGDTEFLWNELVDKYHFQEVNQKAWRKASGRPGVTRACWVLPRRPSRRKLYFRRLVPGHDARAYRRRPRWAKWIISSGSRRMSSWGT